MIANTTTPTTRKPGKFTKARKLLLGLGGLTVAGILMGAAPAQARDRGFERHDREFRHDVIIHRDFGPAVVCDPVDIVTDQIWVPARYEFETRWFHGHPFTERVLVEPGHYVCR